MLYIYYVMRLRVKPLKIKDMNKYEELSKSIKFNLEALDKDIINQDDFRQAIEEIYEFLK